MNQDEEYQPSQTNQYSAASGAPSKSQFSPELIRKGKRVLVILFLFSLVFALSHVFKKSEPEKSTDSSSLPEIAKQVPSVQSQSSEIKTYQSPDSPSENSLRIQNLQDSVGKLETQLAHLNQLIQSLDQEIQALKSRPIPESQPLNRKPVRTQTRSKGGAKGPVYYLKAVVPGRAWLQTAGGEVLTVKEGDWLSSSYGKVKKIDSSEGLVITQGNKVIAYGKDDR